MYLVFEEVNIHISQFDDNTFHSLGLVSRCKQNSMLMYVLYFYIETFMILNAFAEMPLAINGLVLPHKGVKI